MLFQPLALATPLKPQQAAALKAREKSVDVDGFVVSEMFQSFVRESDFQDVAHSKSGEVLFGFQAQTGPTLLRARWNELQVSLHRGKILATKDVTAAFSGSPRK